MKNLSQATSRGRDSSRSSREYNENRYRCISSFDFLKAIHRYIRKYIDVKKGKAIPVTGRGGP
jgi:hypothetical protein